MRIFMKLYYILKTPPALMKDIGILIWNEMYVS